MEHENNKRRKLPRHVDGRIMVGLMPLKNFFMMLPVAAAIMAAVIKYFSPAVFFAGVFILGLVIGLFSEFHQKETGFFILKNIIRYAVSKEVYFERNTVNEDIIKRFTRFEPEERKKGNK